MPVTTNRTRACWQAATGKLLGKICDTPNLLIARIFSSTTRNTLPKSIRPRAELAPQRELVIPFFAFPEGVRRISLHHQCNRVAELTAASRRQDRGHFPSDDAATKLLYLVLNHAVADWKRPPREWAEAKTQFAVMFKERFVRA